jgi:hypothetical protein
MDATAGIDSRTRRHGGGTAPRGARTASAQNRKIAVWLARADNLEGRRLFTAFRQRLQVLGWADPHGDAWVTVMTWFDFFKTFAGPIATVVASATAGGVAIWFGVVQAGIARSQAATAAAQKDIADAQLKIAFDKLKHDLFDKRYEIYLAAKEVIEAIFNRSPVNDADRH